MNPPRKVHYDYSLAQAGQPGTSSGQTRGRPNFNRSSGYPGRITLFSESDRELSFSNGSHVIYSSVAVSEAAQGKLVTEYQLPRSRVFRDEVAPDEVAPIFNGTEGLPVRSMHFAEGSSTPYRSETYVYTQEHSHLKYAFNMVSFRIRHAVSEGGSPTSHTYGHPATIAPRLKEVTVKEDGRTTKTRYTYDTRLKGPYPTYVRTDLPDGSYSYNAATYLRDHYPDPAIAQACLDRNYVAVPFSTYEGKDGVFHKSSESRYSFYTDAGDRSDYPTPNLSIWKTISKSKASSADGESVDPQSTVEVVSSEVFKTFADGTPRLLKQYGSDLLTMIKRENGRGPIVSSGLVYDDRDYTDAGATVYTYEHRLLASTTTPDGVKTIYTYDNQNRVESTHNLCSGERTYFRYFHAIPRYSLFAAKQVAQTHGVSPQRYYSFETRDGFGRAFQSVSAGTSDNNTSAGANGDGYVYSRVEYDQQGRVRKKYDPETRLGAIPFQARVVMPLAADGRWTSYDYEDSPRGRLEATTVNNGFTTTYAYGFNSEPVRNVGAGGVFAPLALSRTAVTDHAGYTTVSLSDSWGNTIQSFRSPSNGGASFQVVDYGYDKQNQLMRVVPAGLPVSNVAQHYQYKYDALGRLISKVLPGQTPHEYVYDSNGRLAGYKLPHSRLASNKFWAYTYDSYGQREITGLVPGELSVLTTLPTDDIVDYTGYSYAIGTSKFLQPTSRGTRSLDVDRSWTWITTTPQYEGRCGAVSGSEVRGFPGASSSAVIKDRMVVDDGDLVTDVFRDYPFSGHHVVTHERNFYTWDRAFDRHNLYLAAGTSSANLSQKFYGDLLEVEYDKYGQLAYERHDRSFGQYYWAQQRDYRYDDIGRLTAINQPLHRESEANYLVGNGNGLPGESAFNEPRDFPDVQYWSDQSAQDLFFEEIRYDARIFGGASTTAHHGSLIQETVKAVRGRRPVVESYGYDAKLRLSSFRAYEVAASDAGAVATYPYALHAAADYTYDELSRPVTTRRSGFSAGATPAYGQFDNLAYRYDASGRPEGITDYANEPGGHPTGAAQTAAYVYNAAGDIEVDPYRQLRYEYNALGLASRIYVYAGPKLGTESLYYYTAGGALVESKTYDATRALVAHVYYLDGHRYDAVRDEVYYATRVGATVLDANNDARHIRYHHDHLGNVVLAYSDIVDPWLRPVADGRIDPRYEYLEEQQYFPYGMTRNGYTAGMPSLPFAYNGAEYSDALDLHLTTYRTMALETGLWGQVDPKASLNYAYSPYSSMNGNPITHADPDGDVLPAILAGALIGAAISGATTVASNVITNQYAFKGFGRAVLIGAIGGAVTGGVGEALAGKAIGQGLSGGLLKSTASYAATSAISGEPITLGSAAAVLAGGLVSAGIPSFAAVDGGAIPNIIAETAYNTSTGAIVGGVSGGVGALVDGRDVSAGIARGAYGGAVSGIATSALTIGLFGSAYKSAANIPSNGQVYRRGLLPLRGNGGGFTAGDNLLVNGDSRPGTDGAREYTEWHETVHHQQIRDLGIGKFYWKLGIEQARRVFSSYDPYTDPGSFENQAHVIGRIMTTLSGNPYPYNN